MPDHHRTGFRFFGCGGPGCGRSLPKPTFSVFGAMNLAWLSPGHGPVAKSLAPQSKPWAASGPEDEGRSASRSGSPTVRNRVGSPPALAVRLPPLPHRRGSRPCGRWVGPLLSVALVSFGPVTRAGIGPTADPVPEAAAFLSSLGVNSAVSRRGEHLDQTVEAVRFLGIRWIRSGYESDVPVEDLLELHRRTGVKFSYGLLSGGTDLERLLRGARRLAAAGALLAIEGNNEPNNWPITYHGQTGGGTNSWLPVARLQRDLFLAVKADPVLRAYPVWTVSEPGAQKDNVGLQFLTIPPGTGTLMPPGTRYADAANVHNYIYHPAAPHLEDNKTWNAADPTSACKVDGLYKNFGRTWREGFRGYAEVELQHLPRVTTETGVAVGGEITEEIHGWHLLTMYLAQFKRGWTHTAVYLLRDRTDEAGNQRFGFYRPDHRPRPAAVYLHRLTKLLTDEPGATARVPAPLAYVVEPQPDTVHDLLLRKRDGTWVLIVWNERVHGSDEIQIRFPQRRLEITVHDPMRSEFPVARYPAVQRVRLLLDRHPQVLCIAPYPTESTGNGDAGAAP